MFDIGIGYGEILLIAVVLIIVVGPEELPGVLRTIGRYVGKIKGIADDFRSQLDEVVRESGVDKIKEEFSSVGDSMEGVVEDLNSPLVDDDILDFEEHNRRVLEREQQEKERLARAAASGAMVMAGEAGAGAVAGLEDHNEGEALPSGSAGDDDQGDGRGPVADEGGEGRDGLMAGSGNSGKMAGGKAGKTAGRA